MEAGNEWSTNYIHNSKVDGDIKYGGTYGFLRRNRVGSSYHEPYWGSRGAAGNVSTGNAIYHIS